MFCISLGALADYGVLTASFIRKFDCQNHDIANSERELLRFSRKMRMVFMEGWFLATHAQTGDGPRPLKGEFITELVRKQTRRACVFDAGPKQLLVWGKCSEADVKDISTRCAFYDEIDVGEVESRV